ncbi:MAG: hypothetical protein LBU38_01290, partial [Propionibacteriaceae bacterium]|nr:hypothetical protein [Propionibacteriaceae bacterium]
MKFSPSQSVFAARRSPLTTVAACFLAIVLALSIGVFAVPQRAEAVTQISGSQGLEPNTFFAYVKANESLNVDFSNTQARVTNPLGDVTTGNSRRAPIGTAGIWKVEMPSTSTYNWNVTVYDGATEMKGRVWFESHTMDQSSVINLTLWAVNLTGYIYRIDLKNFNGVYSRLRADSVGVPAASGCTPGYASVDWSGSSSGSHFPPFLDCGSAYKIFAEEPDPTMPATALAASGTDWLLPPP